MTKSEPTAKSPAPTDLQNQVAAIGQTVARFTSDLAAQQIRVADLANLAEKQAAIHEQLEAEEIDFPAAAGRLGELSDHHGALSWAVERKGASLVTDGNTLRDAMASSKSALLAALNRAAGGAVAKRQAEIATVISKWDGAEAPQSPVPILTIYSACPTCREVEGHRMALEGWRPSLGPQAFLSAAAAAADALAGMNVPADAPLLQGGPNHRGVNLIVGWNGADERLDIVANFATRPEANTAYETFRNRTGLAGLRQLVLLSEATLERQAHLPAGSSEALDYRENGALAERFASGMDPGVIAGITAWLALEYPTKPFPTHENCHHE